MAYFVLIRFAVFAISCVGVFSQRAFVKEPIHEGNFSYHNCNRSVVPLYVNYMNVTPDPVIFGQLVLVDFDVTLDKDVGKNDNSIEVDLSLRLESKKGNISLCQIIGESLCHYNDFCTLLRNFMKGRKCPNYIPKTYHNNCSCPIEKDNYTTQAPIHIPLHALSFELRGTFDLTINVHEEGKILGCFEIHFCVKDCKPLGY